PPGPPVLLAAGPARNVRTHPVVHLAQLLADLLRASLPEAAGGRVRRPVQPHLAVVDRQAVHRRGHAVAEALVDAALAGPEDGHRLAVHLAHLPQLEAHQTGEQAAPAVRLPDA